MLEQIQRWLDVPGSQAMPEPIRDHIRDCEPCRTFIKQWNSIEIGLISMRDRTPSLSTGFASALDARLQSTKPLPFAARWIPRLMTPRQARIALVGCCAALVAWMCYLVGGSVTASLLNFNNHGANVAQSTSSRIHTPANSAPLPAEISVNGAR